MKNNSELLSEFEKYKGYSSNMFDNEEWREFDSFAQGYNVTKKESVTEVLYALKDLVKFCEENNIGAELELARNVIEKYE